jgi:hypothetical protein
VLKVNGHTDRGVRRARFLGVLQGQNRPALLMEGGYLSNRHEAGLIADPAYRQKIAEAMAHELILDAGNPPSVASQSAPSPTNRETSNIQHRTSNIELGNPLTPALSPKGAREKTNQSVNAPAVTNRMAVSTNNPVKAQANDLDE